MSDIGGVRRLTADGAMGGGGRAEGVRSEAGRRWRSGCGDLPEGRDQLFADLHLVIRIDPIAISTEKHSRVENPLRYMQCLKA